MAIKELAGAVVKTVRAAVDVLDGVEKASRYSSPTVNVISVTLLVVVPKVVRWFVGR